FERHRPRERRPSRCSGRRCEGGQEGWPGDAGARKKEARLLVAGLRPQVARRQLSQYSDDMLSLSAVAGHARLTTLLSQAIARGTLPPTLLFAGRAGVGKFLTARAVAATLNCLAPVKDVGG